MPCFGKMHVILFRSEQKRETEYYNRARNLLYYNVQTPAGTRIHKEMIARDGFVCSLGKVAVLVASVYCRLRCNTPYARAERRVRGLHECENGDLFVLHEVRRSPAQRVHRP